MRGHRFLPLTRPEAPGPVAIWHQRQRPHDVNTALILPAWSGAPVVDHVLASLPCGSRQKAVTRPRAVWAAEKAALPAPTTTTSKRPPIAPPGSVPCGVYNEHYKRGPT